MQIIFYQNFTKRENSTLRPTAGAVVRAYTVTGFLRDNCSILHPVIGLKQDPVPNGHIPAVLTYAYIPDYGRYYFVRDWTWEAAIWYVSMDVDVLATYRMQIGLKTCYIERSSYTFNGAVIDRLYPGTTDLNVSETYINAPWLNRLPPSGCFVLGVMSGETMTAGTAVTYYALTFGEMRSLINYLLSTDFLDAIGFPRTMAADQQLTQQVAKCLVDPLQYIVSCMWFPYDANQLGDSTARAITVGYYELPTTIVTGHWVSSLSVTGDVTVAVPVHPQAATRGKYLNYAPFTRFTVFLPPFGMFPLDPSWFEIGDSVNFMTYVDLATGKSTLRVRKTGTGSGNAFSIFEKQGMMGVPIQLAQIRNDVIGSATAMLNAGSAVAGTITNAAIGNPVGATNSALMALRSVGDAISAQIPQISSSGSNGSFDAFSQPAWLTARFTILADENNAEQGRPLCELHRIDTIPGFIKCGECEIDFSAFSEEKTKVHSYLTGGFFWETEG